MQEYVRVEAPVLEITEVMVTAQHGERQLPVLFIYPLTMEAQ